MLFLFIVSLPTVDASKIEFQEGPSVSYTGATEAAIITSNALIEAKHILRRTYSEDITQAQVSHALETIMRAEGADAGLSFPTLTISGEELEEPHGDSIDDGYHFIRPMYEPIVMIDIGCKYLSHCTDVTRTFFFESATQEMLSAYQEVLETEIAIIEALAPGVLVTDLDNIHDTMLANYSAMSGFQILNIWGHGVTRYVHDYPLLYGGSTGVTLQEGDVLAIEPGIYSEDGWAVRVEDTVLVTDTGYEVLSNTPKLLTDVMINSSMPVVRAEISLGEYEYLHETSINVSISDTGHRDIDSVYHFDGYKWNKMESELENNFRRTYFLNYSYSSSIDCLLRVQTGDESFYFLYHVEAETQATERLELDTPFFVENGTSDSPLFFTIEETGVSMIRFKFDIFQAPQFDQMLVMDSEHRVFIDLMNEGAKHYWSPWIAGDEIELMIVPTENPTFGGVGEFWFNITTYEVLIYTPPIDPPVTSTPITDTTTTNTIVNNTTVSENFFISDQILIMFMGFIGGFTVLGIIGFVIFRRTGN